MRMTSLLAPTMKHPPEGWKDPGAVRLMRGGYALSWENGEWNLLPLGAIMRDNICWFFLERFLGDNVQQLDSLLATSHGLENLLRRSIQSYRDLPLRTVESCGGSLLLGGIEEEEMSLKDISHSIFSSIKECLSSLNLNYEEVQDLGERGARSRLVFPEESHHAFAQEGVICPHCGWRGTTTSESGRDQGFQGADSPVMKEVYTPDTCSIEALCAFLNIPSAQTIKTMFYMVEKGNEWQMVAVLLRGDLYISDVKLAVSLGATSVRIAAEEELVRAIGQKPGFLGPVGLPPSICLVADRSVVGCRDVVIGANRPDYHLTGIVWGRDFSTERVADIVTLEAGMDCPACGEKLQKSWWSDVADLWIDQVPDEPFFYQDKEGASRKCRLWRGRLSLDVIMTTLSRKNTFSAGIAPFDVEIIVPAMKDLEAAHLATDLYCETVQAGMAVLFDDRDERAGAKFADADLFGIPARVVVGRKAAEGIVEVHFEEDTREMQAEDVPLFLASLFDDDEAEL